MTESGAGKRDIIKAAMITVALAFSGNIITQGIRALLAGEKDFRLLAVSPSADLRAYLAENQADILIADFIVLANALSSGLTGMKTILIDTGCGDENIHYAFLSKSINGFIRADADAAMLIKAIRTIRTGHLWIDNRSVIKLIDHLIILEKIHSLSPRERDIISLLGTGMDEDRISASLAIKKKTVDFHIESILKKTGIPNLWDLMRYSMHYLSYHSHGPAFSGIEGRR